MLSLSAGPRLASPSVAGPAATFEKCKQRPSTLRTTCCHAKSSSREQRVGYGSSPVISLSRSAAALLAAAALTVAPSPALANNELVAKWDASGLIFKDSVEVVSFNDAKVDGITIYISEFQRSLSAKLQKDFFSEPSQASLTCTQTGKIAPKTDLAKLPSDGEDVFSERKNLSLATKTLRVRRLYDEKNETLVYVAYSTRFSSTKDEGASVSSQYKTSICAIPLYNSKPAPPLETVVAEVESVITAKPAP